MKIVLFDIDNTLTPSGEKIPQKMVETIIKLSTISDIVLGLVGGGKFDKLCWQLGDSIKYFKYIFTECGSVIYVDQKMVMENNMLAHCNRTVLNNIISKALYTISQMPIIYHGNQIDFRKGLIYISPPGIQATEYERSYFIKKDKELNLRAKLLTSMKTVNIDNLFEITFGGSCGIAVFPRGWNKSQAIKYFVDQNITGQIYFFGDKCGSDGNDYPIYSHPLVTGFCVADYQDTIQKINDFFNINN